MNTISIYERENFEQTLNIYQRLNRVMEEVKYIQKGDKRVNNQYRYVSHDQVSSALHEPLTRNGIMVIPNVLDMTQDGNRTTAKVEISFVNIDNPQEKFSVVYVGYGIDQGDKGPGKAISYACKYALLKTFCLETGDDPDHDQNVKFSKGVSKEEIKSLEEMIEKCPEKIRVSIRKRMDSLTDIDSETVKKMKTYIQGKIDEANQSTTEI